MAELTETTPEAIHSDLASIATTLGGTLTAVIDAIPGGPHRPTPLARKLGISRVTASKMLNALARPNPYEMLQDIPGPESLRAVTAAAPDLGADASLVREAEDAIDRFAQVIRRQFGTRAALNAAISPRSANLQARVEQSSRYEVFKGMRQIMGVEAETWLTSMIFAPSPADPMAMSITTIHGAMRLRRLRPDVPIYFTFGPPKQHNAQSPELPSSPFELNEFCTNTPATMETEVAAGQLVHRLAHDKLGKEAVVDMLAASHNPRGAPRYASPERSKGGVSAFVDIPVKNMVCDALVHADLFPGSTPELLVYNPGARGPANPNDPRRDIDLIAVPEEIEYLGKAEDRFDLAEAPRYPDMVARMCAQIGHDHSEFRLFRLRMAYPVTAFQFVMAFRAPPAPAG
ncbi:MAG: hypothetical protein JJU33_03780 [Phycisphaerales bacterium]|nr:hypothetical protein [Phycisphaerales bacterium]